MTAEALERTLGATIEIQELTLDYFRKFDLHETARMMGEKHLAMRGRFDKISKALGSAMEDKDREVLEAELQPFMDALVDWEKDRTLVLTAVNEALGYATRLAERSAEQGQD